MYNYLLTCSLWLEALTKKEVQKQGYDIAEVTDKAVYFRAEIEAIARMNLWSRFGNILYLVVWGQKRVEDFDTYFDAVYDVDWEKYIPKEYEIVVKATSIKSELWALSSLQGLAKKAIVKKLAGDAILRENPNEGKIEVRVLLENNTLRILLNTSGQWLHKRWYRELTGQAPLKENIAAALVILSWWKFKEAFYDLFCGSGTIAIEALMIAKNRAPGLRRNFAFEDWDWVSSWLCEAEKKRAAEKEFSGEYKVHASDIRKEVVEAAKRSAIFAGLQDEIEFSCQDFSEVIRKRPQGENMWIVSNPPYGLRLSEDDAQGIHGGLAKAFTEQNILWGIITSDLEFEKRSKTKFKKRKLYNGGELCYFYRKM